MKLIYHDNQSPIKAKVMTVNNFPETVENKAGWIEVEFIPESIPQLGKTETLYINPTTNAMWYEYTDRPLIDSEVMAQNIADMQIALANMMGV